MTAARRRCGPVTLALLASMGLCVPARSSVAAPPARDAAAVTQAQERYRRGLTLYEEGDISGALVELKRAYQLTPAFKILYNLGQIAAQAHDYAAALGYFRRYLADGGETVPATRRREVESEIRVLKERTGSLDIRVSEPGATIAVDAEPVGESPLASPVRVNVGRHRVEASLPSGQRRTRSVEVAGEETVTVRLEIAVSTATAPRPAPASPDPAEPSPTPADKTLEPTLLAPDPEKAAPAPSLLAPDREKPAPVASLLAPDPEPAPSTAPTSEDSPRPARRSAWLSWGLTAALAVGAGITGGLALGRSRKADDALDSFPASPQMVDELRRGQHNLALASDGLLVGTLLMAGVSTYLSLSGAGSASSRTGDLARAGR